ncbi:MAG TPA: hypothetical protein VER55_03340, partial [Ardenticatenaceae bacterium]|nr:hypothetical protein [Ardenticatenaceae bacterium]
KAQAIQPDICIRIHRIQPRAVESEQTTHTTLTAVLDRVHAALKNCVEVRCRGVFLDQLTATAHGDLVTAAMLRYRDGDEPREPLEALLLCPKPHMAPWRVDVVSHSRDCCRNAVVCHVKGFPDVRPPQRLVSLDDISEAIRLTGDEADDETRAWVATQQVLAITRRYAQLLQPDIATYRRWIRERLDIDDRFDTTALLNEAQRETLALGRFLWEQIEHIRASNFAGPVLLFTGVLEEVTLNTVFQHCPTLYDARGTVANLTLGTLGFLKMQKGTDWETLEQAMAGGLWNEHLTEDQVLTFSKWVSKVESLKNTRNDAAHRARVEPPAFQKLVNTYFGSSLSGIGVLNALLLAWQGE